MAGWRAELAGWLAGLRADWLAGWLQCLFSRSSSSSGNLHAN